MTCIVGVVHDGAVYLGGDSIGIAGHSITPRADAKVFKNGLMVMGFCGSFRMGQLLQYKFTPPAHVTGTSLMKYMVTHFVDSVRMCFRDGGYSKEVNKSEQGGFFLVGFKGHLYEVQADYQVAESSDPWTAIGSGKDYALGSLYATKDGTLTPEERIVLALEAAAYYHGGVAGPFKVVRLDA